MYKFLRGLPATIPVAVTDDAGPVTLDAPPSVVVTDAEGAQVASGLTTGTGGAYTFVMPSQVRLGVFTVAITGLLKGASVNASTLVECVGAFAFTVADLRGFDDAIDTRYTDNDCRNSRAYVEDEFRMITGRSVTPRAAVETVDVSNGCFYLANVDVSRIVSMTMGGTPVDMTAVTVSDVGAGYVANVVDGPAVVEYEYGFPYVPDDIKRAALQRGASMLYQTDSGIPDRATSYNIDGAQYALATAGRAGFETGMPEVDAVLARYRIKPPGVA